MRFVGNTNFTTQLLRRNPTASRGHDVDRVEPEFQRSCGILKYSAFHRMLMASAILASVRRALGIAMMFRDHLALGTEHPIWVMALNQIFETGGIVGELPLELHERIGAIRRAASGWIVAIRFAHALTVAQGSTAVKGIRTKQYASPIVNRADPGEDLVVILFDHRATESSPSVALYRRVL
jgi:hypothetical protein